MASHYPMKRLEAIRCKSNKNSRFNFMVLAIQTLVTILTAIGTTLGVTSCMM